MKFTLQIKKITIISSFISTLVIIVIVGLFIFIRANAKFKDEVDTIRQEYYEQQKKLIKNEIYKTYDYIIYHQSKTDQRLKSQIKDKVYEVDGIVRSIYNSNRDKSDEEIINIIKYTIGNSYFNGGKGYCFIGDMKKGSFIQLSNNPKRNLTAQSNFNCEENLVMKDMIHMIETKQEGYYTYKWSKPNCGSKNHEKISYIKYFEPLNIFIGTGLYKSDVEEEIKKEVIDRIRALVYEDDGYIFITTYEGEALVFQQEEYIGKKVIHLKDSNDVFIQKEIMKVINENGEGYVKYCWPKANEESISSKITFVKGMEDWGWVIGTGVYIDEIETVIKTKEAILKKDIQSNILRITSILCTTGLLIIIIQLYLLKKIEYVMKEEEKIYEILTNLSEDGIFILNPKGQIQEINEKGLQMLSTTKRDLKKSIFNQFFNEPLLINEMCEMYRETYMKTGKDNIPVELNIKRVEINKKDQFIAYVRDLSERKMYEAYLKELAITDELTNVYNRRFIIDQLKYELEKVKLTKNTCSVVMIDVDNYKQVNDKYGHVFGDEVLKRLTKTFKENLREIDFIGRYGGEEFIIILTETVQQAAEEKMECIKHIFQHLEWKYDELEITFSAGIVEINAGNCYDEANNLIKQVDKLLYKAKKKGRNRIEINDGYKIKKK